MQMQTKVKERKEFLAGELERYEEKLNDTEVGTKQYEEIKKDYMEIYKELYPRKCLWDKVIDIASIIIPAAVSVGLGIYAYHKNDELVSKDGDVWREARRR